MRDTFQWTRSEGSNVIVAVALTTDVCRTAQSLHTLSTTPTVALGRLMTSAVLVGGARLPLSTTSIQVLSEGRLRQVFADVNEDGHIRGYIKENRFTVPLLPNERSDGRRSVAAGIVGGRVSVIRYGASTHFTQSTVELSNGEIDADVERFLWVSDQIPTLLICDVILDSTGGVDVAGGILVQRMPDSDEEAFQALCGALTDRDWAARLREHPEDAAALLRQLVPRGSSNIPKPLVFRCRCSYERVLVALQMLGPKDLAEMVDAGETPSVNCEFCGKTYVVAAKDVENVFLDTITGRA